ncbi:MAG: penicillin-binding protein 2 [Patescibacteria group bacterium]|jgi:cell division protein FtsI/penicillin-binding protein 2
MKHIFTKKSGYSLHTWRIQALWLGLLFFGLAIIGKLFWLQVWQGREYQDLATRQQDSNQELLPDRGLIYAQDTRVKSGEALKLSPLAVNQTFYLLYAQTFAVTDPINTATKLNEILDLPPTVVEKMTEQLRKDNDPYEPLVHRVTEEKIKQIEALGLPGIKWEEEKLRYYPGNNNSSNLLGFVGWVNDSLVGQYGLEGYFDKELTGRKGFSQSARDGAGRLIGVAEENYQAPQNGDDLILTIDSSIQDYACGQLDEAVKKYDADGGAVVVMNPKTGAILAMCGNPNYNPNAYNEVDDIRAYTNPAIFDPYEPGSVFKPLTLAAALDQGKITPDMTYEDKGEEKIAEFTIRNSDLKAHGTVDMVGVLKLSLNTGAIFAMRQIGPEIFRGYMEKFGFGELAGIELNKEVAGTISSLSKRGEIYAATASFGQGIMVTPLQLVAAYGALANGGQLMKPYIVAEIHRATGEIEKTAPQMRRQVISERSATLISGMMVQVVREGYGKLAGVPGYYIAGKTGTAQVTEAGQAGYGNRTIHTFAGFGPVANPVFVMAVRLDHPTAARFAESTATPVWGNIAKFILNYYQVEPDETSN